MAREEAREEETGWRGRRRVRTRVGGGVQRRAGRSDAKEGDARLGLEEHQAAVCALGAQDRVRKVAQLPRVALLQQIDLLLRVVEPDRRRAVFCAQVVRGLEAEPVDMVLIVAAIILCKHRKGRILRPHLRSPPRWSRNSAMAAEKTAPPCRSIPKSPFVAQRLGRTGIMLSIASMKGKVSHRR